MKMRLYLCVALVSLSLTVWQFANADADPAALAAVTNDVKEVCTQPATQGQHWSVTGGLNADAGIQVKLLKLASIGGNLQFTKEEWSGIQRVLAADQAGDNESYRRCVQALVPQFLAKVGVGAK
jgi:hypothetical protein